MSESFLCVSDRNPRRCRHSRGSYSSAVPSYVVCTQARRCVRPVLWRAHVRMILHEVIVLLVVGHQTRDEVHVRLEELFCVGWGAEFDIDIERSCRHWEEYDLMMHSEEAIRSMMMLTFIASPLIRWIQILLKGTSALLLTAMLALAA